MNQKHITPCQKLESIQIQNVLKLKYLPEGPALYNFGNSIDESAFASWSKAKFIIQGQLVQNALNNNGSHSAKYICPEYPL